jgi:hypothetical protein
MIVYVALSATSLALAPESVTKAHLSGRITPKSGDELAAIGKLFTQFLAGQNQTLSVQGNFVQPSGTAAVGWLSDAFKTLTLQVTLPGQIYQVGLISCRTNCLITDYVSKVINSVTISDLEIIVTENSETFAPLASSQHTLATYKNPFGFSLRVVQAAEDIILGEDGQDVAEVCSFCPRHHQLLMGVALVQLKLPRSNAVGGLSTGNVADLEISFSKQPLQSLNNAVFAAFFAAVTDTQGIKFELKGSVDVVARTTIGDVPISNILFNVTSDLKGKFSIFGHFCLR